MAAVENKKALSSKTIEFKLLLHFGSMDEYPENWDKLTVINRVNQLKNGELAISIDCGVDDFFLAVNRALHQ